MASLTCLANVARAAGHAHGWLGLLHKLGSPKARPSVQVTIHTTLTSHLLVSHWTNQRDSLASSQCRRGSIHRHGQEGVIRGGVIHVTNSHKLYYAVSSPFWEAPLQQACFLLTPQYSTSGPAGWGQAEAAAGSQSFVQRAAQKRLLVTIFS